MFKKIGRMIAICMLIICMCVITTSASADESQVNVDAEKEIQDFIEDIGAVEPRVIKDEMINVEVISLLDEQAVALINAERAAIAKNLFGAMANQEAYFYDKAIELGIDPAFVVALAAHETGNGSSYLCINNHNFGGMRGQGGWMQFQDKDAGIMAYLNLIVSYHSKGLDTPEKMVSRYAPNSPTWVGVIRGTMAKIERDIQQSRAEVNAYYADFASKMK